MTKKENVNTVDENLAFKEKSSTHGTIKAGNLSLQYSVCSNTLRNNIQSSRALWNVLHLCPLPSGCALGPWALGHVLTDPHSLYRQVYSSPVQFSRNQLLQLQQFKHNCMATADRAVVVFVKEFQWYQRPGPLQNGLIHH